MKRHALVFCAVSLLLGQAASADSDKDHEKKEKKLHLQRKDPPLALVSPSLSGDAAEGSTLTGDDGEWASRTDLSYARRWLRCDRLGAGCVAIAGETGSTHALGRADGGTTLRYEVAATNLAGTTVERSEATAVVRFAPPVNLALPTISGTTIEGEQLTAAAGSWSGAIVAYAFAWERCTSAGCAPISGASGASYLLTRDDAGATISVVVTAQGPDASTSARSLATGRVRFAPPMNLALPTISGTTIEGEQLTAAAGNWSGAIVAYAFAWERCTSGGCAPISGATGASYLLTRADAGATISVVVTAQGPDASTTARSLATGRVRFAPPVNLALPTIYGTPVEGERLTAEAGVWSGELVGYAFAWERCTALGCAPISGATGTSYLLTPADVGATIAVAVTAEGPDSSTSAVSLTTESIRYAAPKLVAAPSVEGDAVERGTLTATPGSWDGPVDAFAYQWERCTATGCAPLSGETAATHLLTSADVGATLAVSVTAFGPGGATTARSSESAAVRYAPPLAVSAPTVSGGGMVASTPRDGDTLFATTGTWLGQIDGISLTWWRCASDGTGCASVGGGTSHALTEADVGSSLFVEALAQGPGGSSVSRSSNTAPIQGSRPRSNVAPAISGLLSVGETLTATVGAVDGTGPISRAYQWLRCGADGQGCVELPGATAYRYRPVAADGGARLRVRVISSSEAGSLTQLSDATTAISSDGGPGPYPTAVLGGSPAAYWRLGEASGTTVNDSSSNGRSGTYVTGVALGQPGAIAGNTSASFNGTSGRAEFGDVFDFTANSPFTIEAFVQPTIIDAWHRRILGKEEKNAAGKFEGYRFAIDTSLGLYCERWSNGANVIVNRPASNFTLGQWYHVACVYDGVSLRLFVNGAQIVAKSSSLPIANTAAQVTVGSYTAGGSSSFWAGGMDELAVYARGLTASELAAHVQAAASRPVAVASAPRLFGELGVGEEQFATAGSWTGQGPLSFGYQWLRCGTAGDGCAPIAGATEPSYRVTEADTGATVRARVTASSANGSTASADSSASIVVPAAARFERCAEVEQFDRTAPSALSGKSADTVVLGSGGAARVEFSLAQPARVSAWARVRTPMLGANRFEVSLRSDGEEPWSAKVTPVLRWQRIAPGDRAGEAPGIDWPGSLGVGTHAITFRAVDPNVELDAVCLSNDDRGPAERFSEPPVRTVVRELSSYGARGDGVTDNSAALASAFAALRPGETLHIAAGRYRFTTALTLTTSQVSIVGDGPGTVLFADFDPTATGRAINVVGGYEGQRVSLTAPALALDREVRVPSTAVFVPGNRVMVSSDPYGPPAPYYPGLFYRNRQNHALVTAVRIEGSEKVLTLDRPLLSGFDPVNNARVERFNGLTGVTFQNLAIEGTAGATPESNADIDLLWVSRCADCFFADLEISHARKSALEVARSIDAQVIRVHTHDATATDGGGHGYGVAVSYGQGTTVRDSLFDGKLRHGVTVSWGSRETFVFANTFDRTVDHPENFGSVDVHGQDDYGNLVEGNQIVGGKEGIVLGGGGTSHGNDGPWNVVRENRISGTQDGISVYKQTYDAVIEGNALSGQTLNAVRIESGSDRAYVWSNRVTASTGVGVGIKDSNATQVLGGELAPTVGPAIRIVNGSGWVIRDVVTHQSTLELAGTGELGSIW